MKKNIVKNEVVARIEVLSPIQNEREFGEPRGVKRQTTIISAEGEILEQHLSAVGKKNRGGFVLSYTERMCDFLKSVSTSSVIRIFLFLAHRQGYGVNGIWGFRCTRKYLHETLKIDKKSVYSALKYLLDNFLIVENRFEGQTEFMVNPDYVTVGTNSKVRRIEWSRRWEWYFQAKAAQSK